MSPLSHLVAKLIYRNKFSTIGLLQTGANSVEKLDLASDVEQTGLVGQSFQKIFDDFFVAHFRESISLARLFKTAFNSPSSIPLQFSDLPHTRARYTFPPCCDRTRNTPFTTSDNSRANGA